MRNLCGNHFVIGSLGGPTISALSSCIRILATAANLSKRKNPRIKKTFVSRKRKYPNSTMMNFMNLLLVCSFFIGINGFRSSDVPATKPSRPTFSSDASRDDDINDDEGFEPLQIPCEINGYIIPAIVDTGAQITVMSESCARRCRVSNLIDGRFCGQAVGMGSSDILGRISELPMRVGPISYHNKVSILRESRVDLILGLDFLRRFKSEINLEDGILKMKVRGKVVRISFITSHNGPLKTFRDEHENSEENVILETEESSSDEDSMYSDSEDDFADRRMPFRSHSLDRDIMRNKFHDKEKSRIPHSKSNDYDDYNEESDEDHKQFIGVSMEGV